VCVCVSTYSPFIRTLHNVTHTCTHETGGGNREILSAFQISLMIVNHPDLLFHAMNRSRDKMNRESDNNKTAAEIEGKINDDDIDDDDDNDDDSDIEFVKECHVEEHDYSWAESLLQNHKLNITQNSSKMIILMKILGYSVRMNERITVFSQSLGTLNIIENLLRKSNDSVNSGGYFYFLRIDGGTSLPARFERIARFNDEKDKTNVMLVSTRAGGEGVNLVGGTRVVLFDCCWNPCHDHEAMCRSHRYGQTKPVYVYRLVGAGTMEKKIYELQLRKESLSKRIVDNDATQRHFRSDELNQYMSMDAYKREMNAETSGNDDVGDDKIMSRLIKNCGKYMRQWFLQDSMLLSDVEGMCQEEEYEVAIQEYKREVAGYGVQQNLGSNLLGALRYGGLQQQQQIGGSGHKLQSLLQDQMQRGQMMQQQLQQQHLQNKVKCPQCGTWIMIPAIPPKLNYIVTCTNVACKMNLKPSYRGRPLLGARVLLQQRGIEDSNELREKAKSLGAAFVAQVSEANIIITSNSSVEKMCERLQLFSLPKHILVFRASWLRECIRLRRSVDPTRYYAHRVPNNEPKVVDLLDDDGVTLDLQNVDDVISLV